MNKNLLLALAFFFIGEGIAISDTYASDLTQGGLVGQVKSVKTTEFTPVLSNKKWIPGEKTSVTVRVYDEKGNMVEETLKDSKEQTFFVTKIQPIEKGKFVEYYSYDENGNIESKESGRLGEQDEVLSMKVFDANDNLQSHTKSQFDKQGNITKITSFDGDDLIATKIYGYDNAKLSFIKVDLEGGEDYVEFYNYDDKGRLVEVKSVSLSGTVLNQLLTVYDEAGNKVSTTFFPSLKESGEHQITKFDKAGRTIELSFYDASNQMVQSEKFEYAPSGLISKAEAYDLINNTLINSYTINYDKFGREFNRVTYDLKGVPNANIETIYKLDKNNNWIEKTEKNKNKIVSIVKREVVYF
ncbi:MULTISPECIES: RHS repeat domain-containing protein [Bacteroides]|uniref:RHS repeat domain-containing protein n=1 Tax=Bacteroides TaxID=816 RepID=UPI001D4D9367|nr:MULTISPECIES: hypothetical protein [Bacteroides]HJD92910.1 hypothetical protein [Bacteroides coprosuis]